MIYFIWIFLAYSLSFGNDFLQNHKYKPYIFTSDIKSGDINILENEILLSIATIAAGKEKIGLQKLKKLIEKNPKKFSDIYHKLFLDPTKSKYTNVLKKGYTRFVDLILFKELAKSGMIDNNMQNYAVNYIFFSSYKNFPNKHLPFMEFFRDLIQENHINNTKENQELLAIFEANYLLSRGREEYAYKILKDNAPYQIKTLKIINYFSSIKNIPIFINRDRLEKILNIKLKASQFEHMPKFLFDFEGKKYEMKDFEW